jgi:hypothetical protein
MRRHILFAASALCLFQSFTIPALVLVKNNKDKGLEGLLYSPKNLSINEEKALDEVNQPSDGKKVPFDVGLDNVAEDYEKNASLKEDEIESALRITRDFMNDTMHLSLLVMAFGETTTGRDF